MSSLTPTSPLTVGNDGNDGKSIDEDAIPDPDLPGEVPAPDTDDEIAPLPPNPGEEPVIR